MEEDGHSEIRIYFGSIVCVGGWEMIWRKNYADNCQIIVIRFVDSCVDKLYLKRMSPNHGDSLFCKK